LAGNESGATGRGIPVPRHRLTVDDVVASPLTIVVGPHLGQATASLMRATGLPSTLVNGEPLTTVPPCEVASPTTIHVRAIVHSLGLPDCLIADPRAVFNGHGAERSGVRR